MVKKVSFGAKPKTTPPADADAWVQQQTDNHAADETAEPMKRLTIDIPEALHRRLKIAAAAQSIPMADLVRQWISQGVEGL